MSCSTSSILLVKFFTCASAAQNFDVAERHQEQLGWFRPGQFPGPCLLSLVHERRHVPEHLPNRLAVPCSAAVGAHAGCAGLSRP
uniref:Putative secreted protein n=1 Tax=Ixodes ricinus TaxID=34613 RepID=A0A6B0U8K9_IXORI